MKRINILLLAIFISFSINAQSLDGSWTLVEENGQEVSDMVVNRIYQDNYFAETAKKITSNEFLWALGGEYETDDFQTTLDFNTRSPELIGKTIQPALKFVDDETVEISDDDSVQIWEKISTDENDLDGNWVITGRKRDGIINTMKPGDRRTIKILGGDRFQWVAFNSVTKEFYGTGGGTYSAKNGKYIEDIDVFSRDKSRIGATLEFDYELKDGEWHHSGKSSKGDPIYEIWSDYSSAYSK